MILLASVASRCNWICSSDPPQSLINMLMPRASVALRTTPYNPASADDFAIMACVLDQDFKQC